MFTRARRRRTSKIVLFALLFAQSALAISACSRSEVSAAQAVAVKQDAPPCHEAAPSNPNLCLADCLSTDQSPETQQLGVPAAAGAAPVLRILAPGRDRRALPRRYVLAHAGAPPPRILFQSFLI